MLISFVSTPMNMISYHLDKMQSVVVFSSKFD